ncbi:sigma-70 family RNA polymerase sigma factor [Pseudenhygromyxa sp. WMMC2535]|nr:sigma-70 family RNA polymerase sigma factor [Pseudenhygromyxa sp. WMMC2535]NVB41951.1 sigma-70 family RNA polymerase sigma factor [Pseudenhygromyxa sp. WMMC2535]
MDGHASNTPAFEDLYRRERAFVLRTLARFGIDEAQREDAAQEVFLVVHRRWGDWTLERAPARSWLYGIARRVAATRRRGTRRREQYLRLLPLSAEAEAFQRGPADPDEALTRERGKQALCLAFERLDEGKREVFELATLDGRSGPEIAAKLGLEVNTVYSRLRLARAQLVDEARRLHGRCGVGA